MKPRLMLLMRCKLFVLLILMLSSAIGCGGKTQPDTNASTSSPDNKSLSEVDSTNSVGTSKPQPSNASGPSSPPAGKSGSDSGAKSAPSPSESFAIKLREANELIQKHEFEKAQVTLDELEKGAEFASVEQTLRAQLANSKEEFEDDRQAYEDQLREVSLANAVTAVDQGKLDEATTLLESLLAAAPTTEQGEAARALQQKIERHRSVRRRLRRGMELLASPDRIRAKEAQEILWEEQEVAYPLLLQSLESENTALVTNCLELLRKFNQPQKSVSAVIGILQRENQSSVWPVAIRELQRISVGGAGKPLLQQALATKSMERAVPLLTALSGVVDPPVETLPELLPLVYDDGPSLAAALSAIYQSISVNHQHDVLTRRGLDLELTSEQNQQLNGFAERLAAIENSAKNDPARADAAWAAKRLAIAMRLVSPQALSGVKVMRATGELPGSPASAVLDKVWNSVDPKTMWLHPPKRLTTIVLDLGVERTVTGIRVWNANEQSAAHRGWKDVEIYVSSDPSPTAPVAVTIIPTAPGAPETPDYGAILQVLFTKGRYVKMQMLSVWRDDVNAGISELEVLGY